MFSNQTFQASMKAPSNQPLLSLMVCLFLASMFVFRISISVVDPDIWHEMALIRESITMGHILTQDIFAYTPTLSPVVHHEWGAGAIAYFLAIQFGPQSIIFAKYLLACLIAALSVICARRRGTHLSVLAFVLPVGILLIDYGFSPIRAQLYTYIFVAALLIFIDLDRKGNRRWTLFWIPMFVVWINLHGGFTFGFLLLGAHWLEQVLRRKPHLHLIILGAVMTLLIMVNPYGPSYYPYIWHALIMARPHIAEWGPLWRDTSHHIGAFVVSALLLAYSVVKIGFPKSEGVIPVLACALAAIVHNRFIDLYALAWVCYVPAYVQITSLGESMTRVFYEWRRSLVALWSLASMLFIFRTMTLQAFHLLVPGQPNENFPNAFFYPVGAVEYLKEQSFNGNLMVPFDYGAYASWKLYPAVKVSIDSRYEVAYPARVEEEMHRFYGGDGWRKILDTYPSDLVLVPKRLPLADLMPQTSGWHKVYSDRAFELYCRNGLGLPSVDRSDHIFWGAFP